MARLPPAVGANGEPPRPPSAVSKRSTPSVDRRPSVEQGRAASVVEVQADVAARRRQNVGDPPRGGHARRIGEGHLLDAVVAGSIDQATATSSGVICSPSNGEPKQHEITTSSTASGGHLANRGEFVERLPDRHADVLLAVRRRRRHGDRQVVDAGTRRQLCTLDVGHQRPQRDVEVGGQVTRRGDHLGRARHRRDRLRAARTMPPRCP